jgi:hypothetical protein
MAIKYFCDRCEKEKEINDVRIIVAGYDFNKQFCEDCTKELIELLKKFYNIEKPVYVKQKGIY